jgi:hypothetical protein
MKPLRGDEGGTGNMTGKVGADTGGVESANANGGAGHCTFRLRLGYLVRKWGIHRWQQAIFAKVFPMNFI